MLQKQEKQTRIKVKKISIRGDEVAILFFSLVFLVFLFLSFFRLFAIGKLFDDFFFTFLFGWSKYLVYLFLFIVVVPICFNRYFRFKTSFVLSVFFTIFVVSWLVANINLIVQTQKHGTNIWLQFKGYSINDLSSYFNQWWDSTIINNYYGFFADPLSFDSWTNVGSFFPSFAAGGVVAYAIIAVTNYGYFVTNFILNLLVTFIAFSWLFFSRPWLLFSSVFFFFKPVRTRMKEKKINQISAESAKQKLLLEFNEEHKNKALNKAVVQDSFKRAELKTTNEGKKPDVTLNQTNLENRAIVRDSYIINELRHTEELNLKKQEKEVHKDIKESGTLTPFRQLKQDQTIDMNFVVSEDDKHNDN